MLRQGVLATDDALPFARAFRKAFRSQTTTSYPRTLRHFALGVVTLGAAVTMTTTTLTASTERRDAEVVQVSNWSSTHSCRPRTIHEPRNVEELKDVYARLRREGRRARVVGSALSPNGLACCRDLEEDLISLRNMNRLLDLDLANHTVTVECGMTVGELVEELKPHGLTLENLASINSQTLGGFFQVGAHGTGAKIPPVEEQILELTMVSPTTMDDDGVNTISPANDERLFNLMKLSLGCLGTMVSVKMRVVEAHNLEEVTRVMSVDELRAANRTIVRDNRHAKYLWMPYTNEVVVVTSNPVRVEDEAIVSAGEARYEERRRSSGSAMLALLREREGENADAAVIPTATFADLRDALLESRQLDVDHVRRVNAAEAAYHRAMAGSAVRESDRVLAFDCGGEQLVMELAMRKVGDNDVDFVRALLAAIEKEKIAAPIPIEHRFTASSRALLSPVRGTTRKEGGKVAQVDPEQDVWAWVGVVMYLPMHAPGRNRDLVESERGRVTAAFDDYCRLAMRVAGECGVEVRHHWAKLEPRWFDSREAMRDHLSRVIFNKTEGEGRSLSLEEFNGWRRRLDPHGILQNDWLDVVFGK